MYYFLDEIMQMMLLYITSPSYRDEHLLNHFGSLFDVNEIIKNVFENDIILFVSEVFKLINFKIRLLSITVNQKNKKLNDDNKLDINNRIINKKLQ